MRAVSARHNADCRREKWYPEHMLEGLGLMTVGMTTVFAFLGILVISMHVLARVAARFPPAEPPERAAPPVETDDADIAVVLAAIEAWRQSNAASTGRG